MTEYNAGDRIEARTIGMDGEVVTKAFYLIEDEDGHLVTYHPFDPTCPQLHFDEFVEEQASLPDDHEYKMWFEVDVPVAEALPTRAGDYEDVGRYLVSEILKRIGEWTDAEEELFQKPWTLGENGIWTAPDGGEQPEGTNWMLASEGFVFIPWSERESIPEWFSPKQFGLPSF